MRIRFGPGGPGGGSVELDPLVGLDDTSKPLRSKLLAVPALRKRYLEHVRTLAVQWLDWKNLGPIVARNKALIEKEVEADTRKLESYDEFRKVTADAAPAAGRVSQARAQPGRSRNAGPGPVSGKFARA